MPPSRREHSLYANGPATAATSELSITTLLCFATSHFLSMAQSLLLCLYTICSQVGPRSTQPHGNKPSAAAPKNRSRIIGAAAELFECPPVLFRRHTAASLCTVFAFTHLLGFQHVCLHQQPSCKVLCRLSDKLARIRVTALLVAGHALAGCRARQEHIHSDLNIKRGSCQ